MTELRRIMSNFLVYFALFLLFVCSVPVSAQDVYSCGGFIKSEVPLAFDKILVKLFTPEGNLKYETDCAPNNGYYMIPVYNKGHYVVRVFPPKGWIFARSSIEIKVDGETDPCSKGEDLNFEFTGFSIAGKVLSSDRKSGPSGFKVSLRKASAAQILKTVSSTEGGSYEFDSILPGDYIVTGSDSNMCLLNNEIKVTVKGEQTYTDSDLIISGYALTGFVEDQGRPIADVSLAVFAQKGKATASGCDTSEPANLKTLSETSGGLSYICRTKSAADGRFTLPCLSSGRFAIVPSFENNAVHFDVEPKVTTVTIENQPAQLKERFRITGFSVVGRVLFKSDGAGVVGAEVRVDAGKQPVVTDADGRFVLRRVTAGRYKLKVTAPEIDFDPVDVEISPTRAELAPIIAARMNVCGRVILEKFPTGVPKMKQRKLVLSSTVGTASVSITTDQEGRFCRLVDRGSYTLTPQLLPNEKQAGLALVPQSISISVDDRPVKDLTFTQFEAKISGYITCLAPCKKVKVSVLDATSEQPVTSTILATKQQVHKYEIGGLLPGKYIVRVSVDHYCWVAAEQTVSIKSDHATDVNFKQTGFSAQVNSDVDAAILKWTFAGSHVVHGQEKLSKGPNSFCLPIAGKYKLRIDSCHKFSKDVYEYDTENADQPVMLVATKHLITGSVLMPEDSDEFALIIRSRVKDELLEEKVSLTKVANKKGEYRFEHYARSGSGYTAVPTSKRYLFSPEQHVFTVKDECLIDALKFTGQKGIFLNGLVEPALAGVAITMEHRKDKKLTFSAVTDTNGRYQVGPLRHLDDFEFEATKEGYVFSPVDGKLGQFHSYKLSQLTIDAVDLNGAPISGVLVSVSGASSYRSNNLTSESGKIVFIGLSPGDYFVRPIYKEYQFEPPTKTISLSEGIEHNLRLVGKRVSFSCYGAVRQLSGSPVPSAVVEAVSDACQQLHEEATTDADGRFRIRGLQPGCAYRVSAAKIGETAAAVNGAGTYPRHYTVKMTAADVSGVDLVVQPVQTTVELSGRVIVSDEQYLSSLTVSIFREGQPDAPVFTTNLQQASVFFYDNIPIDGETYVARLDTSLPSSQFKSLDLPEIVFKAESSYKYLEFEFKPRKRAAEVEISKSSYIILR